MSVSPFLRFAVAAASGLLGALRAFVVRPAPAADTRYHCVSIRPCVMPCTLAQQLAGRRFLPHEAPSLPLAGCRAAGAAGSGCVYAHHADRRHQDRRADFGCGVESLVRARTERRRNPGRRASDRADTAYQPAR